MAKAQASEHAEQVALFRWATFSVGRFPELALLHAIPNGGHRNKITAVRLCAEGVKRGVPDVCLPVARGGWNGLYIELKTVTGRPSPEQRTWIRALSMQGYRAEVCHGWDHARRVLEDYLATATAAGRRPVQFTVPAQGV